MKLLFNFSTEKKNMFWTNKKFVCILNFHQQIIVISTQSNVQKYLTKGHEQVCIIHLRKNSSINFSNLHISNLLLQVFGITQHLIFIHLR